MHCAVALLVPPRQRAEGSRRRRRRRRRTAARALGRGEIYLGLPRRRPMLREAYRCHHRDLRSNQSSTPLSNRTAEVLGHWYWDPHVSVTELSIHRPFAPSSSGEVAVAAVVGAKSATELHYSARGNRSLRLRGLWIRALGSPRRWPPTRAARLSRRGCSPCSPRSSTTPYSRTSLEALPLRR